MTLTVEQIAAICHETNRAYCTQLGDNSQSPWEDAPEWQRASAISGVKHIMENPGAGPIDSHKSWLKQKKEEGWVYGPVKNVELKQHPCMVPYASLPETQQLKDRLFISVVWMRGSLSMTMICLNTWVKITWSPQNMTLVCLITM